MSHRDLALRSTLRSGVLLAAAAGLACSEAPQVVTSPAPPGTPQPVAPQVDVRGRYVAGFEASIFIACGDPRGWWVTTLDSAPEVHALLSARQAANPMGTVRLYVRWRGSLSDSGQYGHLGSYARQFQPRGVLEARDTTSADCR